MFAPPMDLSGLPNYQATRHDTAARIAFCGRCSTKDNQDPAASIAGQVAVASTLLAAGETFAAYYWDVESGMLGLDDRGQGADEDYARLNVPVPRDGGLPDLLEAIERGDITRVVCERINRVARDMLASLMVEHHLDRRGVPLECANEPQGGMTSGRLELRRSAQVRAEVGRHELVEMSLRGQRQHTANGYRQGSACYGYIAVVDPVATPAANRFGAGPPKQRLALHPDQRRIDTVRTVFRLRHGEGMTDREIAGQLLRNLERHPFAEGQETWLPGRIRRMLAQPKYTGWQVWGMRAARTGRDRPNPISEWVWSREHAHPEIVPLERWYETQLVTARLREQRLSGMARVRAAALHRGVPLREVSASDTHVLYQIGEQRVAVPRGQLPGVVTDHLMAMLEAER
jgi:DNA invertase Pin-like site-specific DNA recombinase